MAYGKDSNNLWGTQRAVDARAGLLDVVSMSLSSVRGKSFEQRVAKQIRRQLGEKAFRDPSSGAKQFKADIRIPTVDIHIEAKSQETIKLREWWEQTTESCPTYKMPMLLIDLNGYQEVAVMRFEDILGMLLTIKEDTKKLGDLQ